MKKVRRYFTRINKFVYRSKGKAMMKHLKIYCKHKNGPRICKTYGHILQGALNDPLRSETGLFFLHCGSESAT